MRVLLVEDSPVDAQAVRDHLSRIAAPIELLHVDRLAGMRAHRREPPDVLLLDLSLPDGEGATSVRRAREVLGDVPIVVMTADDDDQRSIEMLREGAEDYLVKGRYAADTLVRALRYARERHELKRRLAHADRLAAVGHLAAGVAHEVSNPASLVLANTAIVDDLLSVLERPADDRKTSEAISPDFALRECRRLVAQNRGALERIRSVVRALQSYSRLERGRVDQLALNELTQRTCDMLRSTLRHGARLECELGDLPLIAADGGKLEQLLTNLLVNAGQALEGVRDDPRILVTTAHEGEWLRLSVEDNGCGMNAEVRKRLFEPFFTTKDAEVGTGLGMAIVSDIVRHHGGRIECESTPGRGTRFDVWLPVRTGLSVVPNKPEPVEGVAPRGRLLLIDDEQEMAEAYAELLRDHHDVVVAHGGRDAQALLARDDDFDVIVCDLMMPELDGATLYESLPPELGGRFVFCSGGLVTKRTREFAARCDQPLLYKPVLLDELLAVIHGMMDALAPRPPRHQAGAS